MAADFLSVGRDSNAIAVQETGNFTGLAAKLPARRTAAAGLERLTQINQVGQRKHHRKYGSGE